MKLTIVTFTGIDLWTDLQRLSDISQKHPYVEFGLLLSKDWQENGPRFPDPDIIWKLANIWSNQPFHLSLHLCGELAIAAAKGDYTIFDTMIAPNLFSIFERVQLNLDSKSMFDVLHRMSKTDKEVIVQMRTAALCQQFLEGGRPDGMSYLIDFSGGRGLDTPVEIVNVPGIHIGYAGGIGPENVEAKLRTLLDYPSDGEFWIDMETRVRTEEKFDLDKVEEVLRICDNLIKNYK